MLIDKQTMSLILLPISLSIAVVGGVLGVYSYVKEPYFVDQVLLYRYVKASSYDVYMYMKPNNIYDSAVIAAKRDGPIYLNLVDGINISYSYRVEGAKISGLVNIIVFLKHPDGWDKRILEKKIDFRGFIKEFIYINIDEVISIMNKLCGEIGLKTTVFNIIITAYVDYLTSINSVMRKDFHDHSITLAVDLSRNRITVEGTLSMSRPVEEKRSIYIKQSVLGIDVETLRTLSTAISSIGVVATAILAIIRSRLAIKDPLKDFESRYQEIIVSVMQIPVGKETKLIYITNPRELVKVARLLEKPITKYIDEDKDKVMYMVIDGDTVYILEVDNKLKPYSI